MLNLALTLDHAARRHPSATAFVLADTQLDFASLDAAARKVAAGLHRLGVRPGDKVALSCPNLPWFPMVYYGILKAGAVVVPLNVLFKRREIAYHLSDSQARVYLCFEGTEALPIGAEGKAGFDEVPSCEHLVSISAGAERLFPDVPTLQELLAAESGTWETVGTAADDTAVILYTSGTTGTPKGAELSHSNMLLNAMASAELFHLHHTSRWLLALPLFHSFGQTVQMNAGVLRGAMSVMLPRFDPGAALSLFREHRITHFAGVPTMYWALLAHADAHGVDLAPLSEHLRYAVSGGASLPVQVLKDFEARFQVSIQEGYGLSETSPVASFNHLDQVRKPGSIGTPIWGVEMRVTDEDGHDVPVGEPGEIVIRGHNVMKGYYRRPDATAEAFRDGWFRSGDVARMDEDGYFFIVDRTKDMILRGGYNVYPREVEELLMELPGVSLVAVVGIPDESHGEEIKAFVVPKPGASLTAADVIEWCRDRIAAYKAPRIVEFRDSLPMNATGKILKRELRG
ncbi:MAG: long-chain fatty acid--CoA ligase [Gemmatimonadota bacterium]